jgi:putative transcriptional regulator
MTRKTIVRKPPRGGEKILAGLRELHEAIVGGDTSKLTVHTVEIDDPAEWGPRQIKSLRQKLAVSQRIFAQLLAVSPELVSHWEYGIRRPAPIACRLLDKIAEAPQAYLSSLMHRKSA